MSGLWTVLLSVLALLSFIAPPLFGVGCFLWWRRVRHWSFLVLCIGAILFWAPKVLQNVILNFQTPGVTEEQVTQRRPAMAPWWLVDALSWTLSGLCVLAGGAGLISAARDPFLMAPPANVPENQSLSHETVP